MGEYIFAQQNGRSIPAEDTIFGISSRANRAIAEKGRAHVVNATVGMLLDDEGKPIVLSSVDKAFHDLKPADYAPYAPIGGTPGYRKAAIRAALRDFGQETKRSVRAVAAPGGTGALKLAIANYSKEGDAILTADWHWGTYDKIAGEIGRRTEKFSLFHPEGGFDFDAFRTGVLDLLKTQDSLVIILNTPANNPTGYCFTDKEWTEVADFLAAQPQEKKIALVVDTAYIDFVGDEDAARSFLPILEKLPNPVFPMLAFSFSKTFTFYGMRTGALIGLAPNDAVAEEFVRVCEYTARASWSNCNRSGQVLIEHIFADDAMLAAVTEERKVIRNMLIERGQAFATAAKKCGLKMLPFDGGFFAVVPSGDAKALAAKLEEEDIYTVPFGAGIRVSLASMTLAQCGALPAKILEAMQK